MGNDKDLDFKVGYNLHKASDEEIDYDYDKEADEELERVFKSRVTNENCCRISDNIADAYMYEYIELPCPQEDIDSVISDIKDCIISSDVIICKQFSNETLADYITKHIKILNSLT